MKRFLGIGAGVTAMILGAVQSAKAEAIALDFGLSTDAISPGPESKATLAPDWTADIALSFEPSPRLSVKTSLKSQESTLGPSPASDSTKAAQSETTTTQMQAKGRRSTRSTSRLDLKDEQSVSATDATDLFAGDADSLVARAIGSAEGTRTPEGGYTAAYYGHVDPGNGVWNLGSFSYQHGASSPEEADEKQLKRLKTQANALKQQAKYKGLQLSLQEELNGIDLANQAPLAALDRGYIDWLNQARQLNMPEDEAVLWARTRSFLDPDTGKWNAPGLGNNVHSISHDQARRQTAIAHAIGVYKRREETAMQVAIATPLAPRDEPASHQEEKIDLFLGMNLFE